MSERVNAIIKRIERLRAVRGSLQFNALTDSAVAIDHDLELAEIVDELKQLKANFEAREQWCHKLAALYKGEKQERETVEQRCKRLSNRLASLRQLGAELRAQFGSAK